MDLEFTAEVFEWKGPAPHHFVSVPDDECTEINDVAAAVTYGWGMIPAAVQIGDTRWTTSLWPKDGGYVVPLKAVVRRAESIEIGDRVTVLLTIDL